MPEKKIDEVLPYVGDLDLVVIENNLKVDVYSLFRANAITYDYGGTARKTCDRWDWALCRTSETIESKLRYEKNESRHE